MMRAVVEVPDLADLEDLSVEVAVGSEPGEVTVTAWAGDGTEVTLVWDEIAGSVGVRWELDGDVRGTLSRELMRKVSVREERGTVELRVWSGPDDFRGELFVAIGEHVAVTDSFLRA